MFRTSAARSLVQGLNTTTRAPATSLILRASLRTSAIPFKTSKTLSLALRQPVQNSLVRYQSTTSKPYQEAEAAYQKQKLEANPGEVSSASSMHPINSEIGTDEGEKDVDMMAGIRSDFVRAPTTTCFARHADSIPPTEHDQGDFHSA